MLLNLMNGGGNDSVGCVGGVSNAVEVVALGSYLSCDDRYNNECFGFSYMEP